VAGNHGRDSSSKSDSSGRGGILHSLTHLLTQSFTAGSQTTHLIVAVAYNVVVEGGI
jgi:hypothetical protein